MFPSGDLITPGTAALSRRLREIGKVDAILSIASRTTHGDRPDMPGRPVRELQTPADGSGQPPHTGTPAARAETGIMVKSPSLASGTNLIPAAGAASVQGISTEENVSLGAVARALAAFAPRHGDVHSPLPLSLAALDASASEPARFALAMALAVRNSGAFYESHLRDWVRGTKTLEIIRAEPRAQSPPGSVPVGDQTSHLPATGARPVGSSAELSATLLKPESTTAAQLRFVDTNQMHFALPVWASQTAELILSMASRHSIRMPISNPAQIP